MRNTDVRIFSLSDISITNTIYSCFEFFQAYVYKGLELGSQETVTPAPFITFFAQENYVPLRKYATQTSFHGHIARVLNAWFGYTL